VGCFLGSKTTACGDSGDLRALVAGMKEGAFGDVSGSVGRHGSCVRKSLVRLSWASMLWLVVECSEDCAAIVDIFLSRPANIRTCHCRCWENEDSARGVLHVE
jgi:hypothetical protein